MGYDAWGHSVKDLLGSLPESVTLKPSIEQAAADLDKHYIGSRYPNSYPQGAPFEYYTSGEAERAIANAREILEFCEGLLFGPGPGDSRDSGGDGSAEEHLP